MGERESGGIGEVAPPHPTLVPAGAERTLWLMDADAAELTEVDLHWLRQAIELSRRCPPSPTAFSVGALIPALPYLLGASGLLLALVLSAVALFVSGAVVSRFTERSPLYSGGRQLLLGGIAAAVTYAVGNLVGAGVG